VLELGVVVHSLIIGMSLGASDFPSTVRPLVPALTFHQLFEGIGLGGCIVQVRTLLLPIRAGLIRSSQLSLSMKLSHRLRALGHSNQQNLPIL
jgi:hypothetical protein